LGTAGSSTKWQWDWLMDHNTYAVNVTDVVAGELLSATYKVYIGDAAGNEILNGFGASTATVETWTWQASIPEPAGLGLLAAGGLFLTRRRSCALARVSACVLAALAATAFDARAVDYAPAPGWGGMVMLDVTYDPGNKSIALMPETYYFPAGSGPVLQAAGNYDPAQPWGVLNGTVYSRRLGWNDPNEGIADWQIGDLLPAGTSLWINRTGGSPELKTYAVAEYDNTKPYTPIFGTAGSDSKWQWDLFMDHNAVAVDFALLSVPNQLFTATYEVYVGDALGNPLAGYTSATTTWSWTGPAVVPEPTGLALLAAAGALVMQRRRRVHDRSV